LSFKKKADDRVQNLISGSVLLAEDNMVVAASVKDILETLGAQNVFTATTVSGKEDTNDFRDWIRQSSF